MKIKNTKTGHTFEMETEYCLKIFNDENHNDLELIPESKKEEALIKKEEKKKVSIEDRLLS